METDYTTFNDTVRGIQDKYSNSGRLYDLYYWSTSKSKRTVSFVFGGKVKACVTFKDDSLEIPVKYEVFA